MLQLANGDLTETTAIKNTNYRTNSPHGGTRDVEAGAGRAAAGPPAPSAAGSAQLRGHALAQGNCKSSKKDEDILLH